MTTIKPGLNVFIRENNNSQNPPQKIIKNYLDFLFFFTQYLRKYKIYKKIIYEYSPIYFRFLKNRYDQTKLPINV